MEELKMHFTSCVWSSKPVPYRRDTLCTAILSMAVLFGLLLAPSAEAAAPASVLPQFAFGGGWYSALYFTNFSAVAVSFQVSFISDTGAPLTVPSLGGSTVTVRLAAHGSAVLEAPNAGTLVQGYAALSLPAGVSGYAVFRQSVAGQIDQEAVVSLADAGASSTMLTWDENNLTTAVAMVNPSSTAAQVRINVWDENGNNIGGATVSLPPLNKSALVLQTLAGLSAMAGKRGTAQFTATGGSIAVLGLRFNGLAFTSIPTTAGTGAANARTAVLPQIAFGGGWYSALYFSNFTSSPVSFPVNFIADGGLPLIVPPLGGSSASVTVAGHGTTVIQIPNSGTLTQGYASFTLPVGVSGYGVFRQSVDGQIDQEAVVPLTDSGTPASTLTWDEAALTTAVAMVNPSSTAGSVLVTVWDASGAVVGTSTASLPPNNKTAVVLESLPGLSGMAGKRGSAQFTTTGGNIAVLGLRFDGLAFTSIPTSNFRASSGDVVAERTLAQTGMAIAQAATVLPSQLNIVEAIALNGTACKALDGGGSIRLQTAGSTNVIIYYDSYCTKPYLVTDPSSTMTQGGGNQIVVNELATYYGLNGTVLGTMTMHETAVIGESQWNVYGTGTFTPATGARTPVQLGLSCSLAEVTNSCAGAIAQDFPALGVATGAVTTITLLVGNTSNAPVSFTGSGSSVSGPPGSLTLTNPTPTSLIINGGSNYGSTRCSGGEAMLALFPPTPTAWSLTDAGHDLKFDISVVNNTVRNLTFTITKSSTSTVVATGALDQSGTGTITYSDGNSAVIANWVLTN